MSKPSKEFGAPAIGGRAAPRSAPGELTITSDWGDVTRFATIKCKHCGRHWVHRPGSGKVRAFCQRCNGLVCCDPGCTDQCVPEDLMLDRMESGIILPGSS